jgi:hypothetical protein
MTDILTDRVADSEAFRQQLDRFVDRHRKKHEKRDPQYDQSLADVIDKAPLLGDDAVELLLEKDQVYSISNQNIHEVRVALKRMQRYLNSLHPRRRFFILETINFFSSKIGINKLMPALLSLTGEDQRKAVCEFVFPTFVSILKNVETLIENDRIFEPERAHIERGELYVLVNDIARLLVKLFNKDFLKAAMTEMSSVEFITAIAYPNYYRDTVPFIQGQEQPYQMMINDEAEIRRIVLKFVIAIQAHENLYTYSLKRYEYYKQFIVGLTAEDRFKEVDAADVSKILAGCLMANEQIKPDDELIERLIDSDRFDNVETVKALQSFVDQLSPGNIYRLISRLRVSLQTLTKTSFAGEFQEIQKFSVKTILKHVWTGFIALAEKGLKIATEPFYLVFQQIKRTYEAFVYDEKLGEEKVRSSIVQTQSVEPSPSKVIPKNVEGFAQMSQEFKLVETDVIAFRGEREGATFKDFGYNSRIFYKDEDLLVHFMNCFKRLFKILENDRKVRVVTYEGLRNIREYWAAYTFGAHLLGIGMTHIRNPKLPVVEEKSIFPYVLLFGKGKSPSKPRVASRFLVTDNGIPWHERTFASQSAVHYYEPLFLVLHLLPESEWRQKDTQICISFLTRELKRLHRKGVSLSYCDPASLIG